MKKYPFSATKHAHDIEFRMNRAFCEKCDMENGETPFDEKTYNELLDLHDDLQEILTVCMGGGIVQLTGPQIGLAKETVLWAGCMRGR